MSIHIYARQIREVKDVENKAKRLRDEIKDSISNPSIELWEIIDEWEDTKKSQVKIIHIGKESTRWRFVFNHNNWEYYKNIEEMKAFLQECEIFTQYDEEMTFEEFWTKVEERQKNAPSKVNYIYLEGYEFNKSIHFDK